jgi:Helix-turn-helix domain
MNDLIISREAAAHRGRRLEYFTIAWNSLEGLIGIGAGMIAGSVSLIGFGIDSLIEVTSGATLLWRMSADADAARRERNERLRLQQRDKKLIDVARSVGYESDAAFSKAFKRVVGANPGEYLKRGFEGHGNAGMAEDF